MTRLSCFNVKTNLLLVKISYFKLSPITEGVQIPWVGGEGASEAPPKKSMKELCRTPGCYIEVGPM